MTVTVTASLAASQLWLLAREPVADAILVVVSASIATWLSTALSPLASEPILPTVPNLSSVTAMLVRASPLLVTS